MSLVIFLAVSSDHVCEGDQLVVESAKVGMWELGFTIYQKLELLNHKIVTITEEWEFNRIRYFRLISWTHKNFQRSFFQF